MIELLLELFTNRIGLFILGIVFIVGGVYGWKDYRHEANLYNAAIGSEGKTVEAEIVWKNTERSSSDTYRDDGGSTLVGYINIEFETENGEQRVKVYLDSDEYDKIKEGDIIKVNYHPNNPEYAVTPYTDRPSTVFSTIIFGFCIFLGFALCLAVVVSFF